MTKRLGKLRIAILATDGFEQVELTTPHDRLRAEGARVEIVAPEAGTIQAWDRVNWGDEFDVDRVLADADPRDYDMLILPGGVINPDQLRMNDTAVGFIRDIARAKKPIAAICHGPWLLIEAGLVRGRNGTSYASIRTDMENAGAQWRDEPVVEDGGLITSRNPGDLKPFCDTIVETLNRRIEQGLAPAA